MNNPGWGTIARWLESAAAYAKRFNAQMLKGFVICELQADEIRTFVGGKKRVIWVLTWRHWSNWACWRKSPGRVGTDSISTRLIARYSVSRYSRLEEDALGTKETAYFVAFSRRSRLYFLS